MNLNPFIKVKLSCPVSADIARERLREATEDEKPWSISLFPSVRYHDGANRYIGWIRGLRFKLHLRPSMPVSHIRNYSRLTWGESGSKLRDIMLAITGEIRPVPGGCEVHLAFKPKPILLIIFLLVLPVYVLATVAMYVRHGGILWVVPMVHLLGCLAVALTFYFSAYHLEREYLESLFTSEKWYSDSVDRGEPARENIR